MLKLCQVGMIFIFLSATYSTDGQTPGCLDCPQGLKPRDIGATSVEQCTGIDIFLL